MKNLVKLVMFVALSIACFGQVPTCPQKVAVTTSVSGTPLNVPNDCGGMSVTFEILIVGAPTSSSILIQGGMRGGTLDTLQTYVGNAARSNQGPAITKVYDFFSITPTWSGGSFPVVSINATETTATLHGASGGGTTVNTKVKTLNQWFDSFDSASGNFTSSQILDSDLGFSDITTGNASFTSHGFVPKLPNDATKFYNGVGTYTVPAGSGAAPVTIAKVTSKYIDSYTSGTGLFTASQLAYTDLTGLPQLAVTKAAVAHFFITSYTSTTGIFGTAQPDWSDITNTPPQAVTKASVGSQWLKSYDATTGLFTATQPALTDISGVPAFAVTKTNTANQWINSYDSTTGLFTATQPAYTNLSGLPTLPATRATTTSQWINSYSSSTGLFTSTQPAEVDLSFSAVTTNNVSATKHGFIPALPSDATRYFDGNGNWTVPPGSSITTKSPVTHQWLNGFTSGTGLFTATQPDISDLTGNPIGGTGTANFIPKFTGTNTQGASLLDDGATLASTLSYSGTNGIQAQKATFTGAFAGAIAPGCGPDNTLPATQAFMMQASICASFQATGMKMTVPTNEPTVAGFWKVGAATSHGFTSSFGQVDLTGTDVTGQLKNTSFPALIGDTVSAGGTYVTKTRQIHYNTTAVNFAASPYTIISADSVIICDATAGNVVVNLPAATGTGNLITLKKVDISANTCTLDASGAETIDGVLTNVLTTPFAVVGVVDFNTSKWMTTNVASGSSFSGVAGNLMGFAAGGTTVADTGIPGPQVVTTPVAFSALNDVIVAAGASKVLGDSGISSTNLVQSSANFVSGNLIQGASASKAAQDSGVATANVPLLNGANTFTNVANTFNPSSVGGILVGGNSQNDFIDIGNTACTAANCETVGNGEWIRLAYNTTNLAFEFDPQHFGTGAARSIGFNGTQFVINQNGGVTWGAGKSILASGGNISKYNNIAGVGAGVPFQVATIDLTAQSAAKTATTLYVNPASGSNMFQVCWTAVVTTAATTSSTLGSFKLTYTDVDTNASLTTPASATNATNAIGASVQGCVMVDVKFSTTLQYVFDYTSSGGTAMVYALHVRAMAL